MLARLTRQVFIPQRPRIRLDPKHADRLSLPRPLQLSVRFGIVLGEGEQAQAAFDSPNLPIRSLQPLTFPFALFSSPSVGHLGIRFSLVRRLPVVNFANFAPALRLVCPRIARSSPPASSSHLASSCAMDSPRCAPRVVAGNDAHDDAEKPVRPRLSLDGLHADVLAQIVDACDHRSRLALLRTTRTLSTFADEALLAVVSLGMRHAADGLIDALERRPERASRLRELNRSGRPGHWPTLQQMARIIRMARGLRMIGIALAHDEDTAHTAVETLRPALVGLEIRELALTQFRMSAYAPTGSAGLLLIDLLSDPLSMSVQTLRVASEHGEDDTAAVSRMPAAFPALRQLSLNGCGPDVMRALIERAPALEMLQLRLRVYGLQCLNAAQRAQLRQLRMLACRYDKNFQASFTQALRTLTGLVCLEMDGIALYPAMLDAIPPSVVRLVLGFEGASALLPGSVEPGRALAERLERGRMPALRGLSVVRGVDSDALERICEDRGIQLNQK